MPKQNCWEFRKCGLTLGGEKAKISGACPASIAVKMNGLHGGINGGRSCWVIEDTLFDEIPQGNFTMKFGKCLKCSFYLQVRREEGKNFVSVRDLLNKVKE